MLIPCPTLLMRGVSGINIGLIQACGDSYPLEQSRPSEVFTSNEASSAQLYISEVGMFHVNPKSLTTDVSCIWD